MFGKSRIGEVFGHRLAQLWVGGVFCRFTSWNANDWVLCLVRISDVRLKTVVLMWQFGQRLTTRSRIPALLSIQIGDAPSDARSTSARRAPEKAVVGRRRKKSSMSSYPYVPRLDARRASSRTRHRVFEGGRRPLQIYGQPPDGKRSVDGCTPSIYTSVGRRST